MGSYSSMLATDLSCGVDDFGEKRLSFVDNFMAEGILDGRIVTLDKMAFAVLDGQGRLPCASGQCRFVR